MEASSVRKVSAYFRTAAISIPESGSAVLGMANERLMDAAPLSATICRIHKLFKSRTGGPMASGRDQIESHCLGSVRQLLFREFPDLIWAGATQSLFQSHVLPFLQAFPS